MKKSRTVRPTAGVESPTTRRLPLVELLIDMEAELFDRAVRSGLQILDAGLSHPLLKFSGGSVDDYATIPDDSSSPS